MARWRMPMWRRLFEEALVSALQAVSEANEISRAMMTGIRFVVRLGCELPESRVLTLHYEDLLPFNELRLHIVCYYHITHYQEASGMAVSSDAHRGLGGSG